MARGDERIPPIAMRVPGGTIDLSKLARADPVTVEETDWRRFSYSVGVASAGGSLLPVIIWHLPLGAGAQRNVRMGWNPASFDEFIDNMVELRERIRAGVTEEPTPEAEAEPKLEEEDHPA